MAQPMLGDAEAEAVLAVLRSGHLAQGRVVAEFEDRFAALCGVKHAIATTSGTTALHVALLAHGIGPGDEVITTAFSFVASANAALYVGARPVFADIDPATLNIDPESIRAKITPRTRAIIAVHLYGNPAALDQLVAICEEHEIVLIEDACQAHGATFAGRQVGSFSTGCFSFYPTKNMTAGEGGMITTDDDELAEHARLLRSHGSPRRYYHTMLGYNFRLSDIHAAIGLAQLDRLAEWTEQRRANADRLLGRIADLPIVPQAILPGARHVYHQCTVRIPHGRDQLAADLRAQGIDSATFYPLPIHLQPLYRDLGYRDQLPHSERAAAEVLSLPIHPALTVDDLDTVANGIRLALARNTALVELARTPMPAVAAD
jgi:dTDP-4-amino-4,6-dideoxygalactose transaminase